MQWLGKPVAPRVAGRRFGDYGARGPGMHSAAMFGVFVARPLAGDHAERRAAVLGAAAALFAEYGVRGTSMSMIASAASGSKSWLYHYYPSKDAIVEDLLAGFLESVVAAASGALAAGGSPAERLRRLLVEVVLACEAAPGGAGLLDLREATSLSARVAALRRQVVTMFESAIVDVDNRLRDFPARRAPVVQSTLGMLSWQHRWWNDSGPLTAEQWGHLAADMVIAGIGAVVADDRLG